MLVDAPREQVRDMYISLARAEREGMRSDISRARAICADVCGLRRDMAHARFLTRGRPATGWP
jgi:hypothetical protein